LLTALDLDQRFEPVCYSMGGTIFACYAADFPQTIRRLVLLAPAGMQHAIAPERHYLSHVPLLGDWLVHAVFARQHRLGTEAERSLPSTMPDMVNLQQNELLYRGFIRSVMASLRGILAQSFEPDHRQLATQKTAVVAIWGR
jgi:pimeloyl-ACP methyl ester carboxylesterase